MKEWSANKTSHNKLHIGYIEDTVSLTNLTRRITHLQTEHGVGQLINASSQLCWTDTRNTKFTMTCLTSHVQVSLDICRNLMMSGAYVCNSETLWVTYLEAWTSNSKLSPSCILTTHEWFILRSAHKNSDNIHLQLIFPTQICLCAKVFIEVLCE